MTCTPRRAGRGRKENTFKFHPSIMYLRKKNHCIFHAIVQPFTFSLSTNKSPNKGWAIPRPYAVSPSTNSRIQLRIPLPNFNHLLSWLRPILSQIFHANLHNFLSNPVKNKKSSQNTPNQSHNLLGGGNNAIGLHLGTDTIFPPITTRKLWYKSDYRDFFRVNSPNSVHTLPLLVWCKMHYKVQGKMSLTGH